jgi:hypothetical protein
MCTIKDEIQSQILLMPALTTESTYNKWTTQFLLVDQGQQMAEGWREEEECHLPLHHMISSTNGS